MSGTNDQKPLRLPVLQGDEARRIDLEVSARVGRVRILETVALRLADVIHFHLLREASATTVGPSPSPSELRKTPLLFVAGKGNNGANALACARILALRGFTKIECVTTFDPSPAEGELRVNIAEQIDLYREFVGVGEGDDRDDRLLDRDYTYLSKWGERTNTSGAVVVDGVLGTGIASPPRGAALEAINAINASGKFARVMAIDMPSGLNHITGEAPGACVEATWTVNLHMFKSGQLVKAARPYVGALWSVETGLSHTKFPEPERFDEFYRDGPIRRVDLD